MKPILYILFLPKLILQLTLQDSSALEDFALRYLYRKAKYLGETELSIDSSYSNYYLSSFKV